MSFSSLNYGFWEFWDRNPSYGFYGSQKCIFDGINKYIIVSDFVTNLSIKDDVYSGWKEWARVRENSGFLPAIRTTGGDPISDTENTGDTYFLINGWKLIIDFSNVAVSGILYSDDYSTPYYTPELEAQYAATVSNLSLSRTVTENIVSGTVPTLSEIAGAVWNAIQADYLGAGTTGESLNSATTGGAPTAAEVADAVWDEAYADHDTDGTFGHLAGYLHHIDKIVFVDTEAASNGTGSQEAPFDNIQDAVDHAETENTRNIMVSGDIILTKNLKNFNITGIGVPEVDFQTNNYDLKNCEFHRVKIKGTYVNQITVQESVLLAGAYLNGFFENCAVVGNINAIASSSVYMKNCASAMPNGFEPTINVGNGAAVNIVEWYGKVTITGVSSISTSVILNVSNGIVTIDNTCTAGTILITGNAVVNDNSNGATVINNALDPSNIGGGMTPTQDTRLQEIWQLQGLDNGNPLTVTTSNRTAAGITQTISGDGQNTTTITRN